MEEGKIINPFEWGEMTTEPFNTNVTVRKASFKEAAKSTFTSSQLDSFLTDSPAPSPELNLVCGFECPE